MRIYRRFLWWWLCGTLAVSACVVLLNRLVDPFDYYRDTVVTGLNGVKNKADGYEREVKPVILRRVQPRTVIVGSSYAEIGFNPDGPALQGSRSYNFALVGAHWREVFCRARYALDNAPVRHLIVGIHPEAMPRVDCGAAENRVQGARQTQLLLSLKAVDLSVHTLLNQHKQPNHTANGLFFYKRYNAGARSRFVRDLALLHCRGGLEGKKDGATDDAALDMSGLSDLLDLARRQNARVSLIFYPHHAYYFEAVDRCAGNEQRRWRAIAAIADAVAPLAHAGLWLFYDYDGYTMEPVTDAPMRYWQDPSHFNHEFGEAMLQRVVGGAEAEGMGMRLCGDCVESARRRFESLRREAHQAQPEFFAALEQLASTR